MHRFESCRSPNENLLLPFDTCVWIRTRVTRRNRQDLNGWNIWLRSLQYFVDEEIVQFGDFAAVGALHFYLTARVVVVWHCVRPDHTEIVFTIGAHERIVAWHGNSCMWICAGTRKGDSILLLLVPNVPKEFDRRCSSDIWGGKSERGTWQAERKV